LRQMQQNIRDRIGEEENKKIDEQSKKLLAKGLELARKYREKLQQQDA